MSGFIYKEIECKSACNNVRGGFPYRWDLNAYRGCGHGCKYCFALYTHRYMESDDFFNEIYVKTNIAERLEILLRSKSWKGDAINLGGVTDSYQPAEERYRLMPEIWKLLIRYKNPAIISTKSDLILRDFELIEELAATAGVNVASTITCSDENDRERLMDERIRKAAEYFEEISGSESFIDSRRCLLGISYLYLNEANKAEKLINDSEISNYSFFEKFVFSIAITTSSIGIAFCFFSILINSS